MSPDRGASSRISQSRSGPAAASMRARFAPSPARSPGSPHRRCGESPRRRSSRSHSQGCSSSRADSSAKRPLQVADRLPRHTLDRARNDDRIKRPAQPDPRLEDNPVGEACTIFDEMAVLARWGQAALDARVLDRLVRDDLLPGHHELHRAPSGFSVSLAVAPRCDHCDPGSTRIRAWPALRPSPRGR